MLEGNGGHLGRAGTAAILVGRERRPYWWGGNGGHIGGAGTAATLVRQQWRPYW